MKALKFFYGISLIALAYSIWQSPVTNRIDPDFIILTMITVGIPGLMLPIFMINKSDKFYQKAKKEGRTRAYNDRGPSPVEEEYRTDASILTIILCFQFIIMIIFLWK